MRKKETPEHKKLNRRNYAKQNMKATQTYLKPTLCPRCGKHGYLYQTQTKNTKTGTTHKGIHLEVRHSHTQRQPHKTVYDGYCTNQKIIQPVPR